MSLKHTGYAVISAAVLNTLADEPTVALDKKSARDVVELMQKLAKEQGCTILLVTHDTVQATIFLKE